MVRPRLCGRWATKVRDGGLAMYGFFSGARRKATRQAMLLLEKGAKKAR